MKISRTWASLAPACIALFCLLVLSAPNASAQELFVSSENNDRVLRFDSATGMFVDFAVGGGLDGPEGLAFGPDGNVYVSSFQDNNVQRYNLTGAPLGAFSGGGLDSPTGLAFGPDGNLYVSSFETNSVVRFSATGAPLGTFVSGIDAPMGLTFDPGGDLFVGSFTQDSVLRFNAAGQPLGALSGGGLDGPTYMTVRPAQQIIPEPGTLALVASALLPSIGVAARRRRR